MKRNGLTVAAVVVFVMSASVREAAAQPDLAFRPGPSEPSTEVTVSGGVFLAPAEIGRDVNRAGGDVLIARLGDGVTAGIRYSGRGRFVGGGLGLYGWLRRVSVRNEAGVAFPNHGESPFLYLVDLRLYPFGDAVRRGRIRPWVGVAAGGALVSVDLDNVDGQELRHLWARGFGTGVMFVSRGGETFFEVGYQAVFLGRSGPLVPFSGRVMFAGWGMRH